MGPGGQTEPRTGATATDEEGFRGEAASAATGPSAPLSDSASSNSGGDAKTGTESSNKENEDGEGPISNFECNICLDVANDAVISFCGHLFCWPCLYTWLETRPSHQVCPVCKAGIGKDKVIPVYGRGNSSARDPRLKPVPPRPRGQRPEPDSSIGGNGDGMGGGFSSLGSAFGGNGGFQMSFGIGAFPLGFFSTSFNMGSENGARRDNFGAEQESYLHNFFLVVALAFIFCLLNA